eukprot:CAMPEP_0202480194 /NCGR_PEP_ID=MMETSP1361-20130828/283_1 /ASSEMBLY_ACC=CAM_ASM_000849 /TAXON_ID=210615 /ORGANISM="Staurosira complex sp., Strain CCMP2646" /LENGTH=579 /DNA_ID=CAMNT_0049107609 /DNA_START=109 /DNA_END=1848 /DNA_ORIENTATION=-
MSMNNVRVRVEEGNDKSMSFKNTNQGGSSQSLGSSSLRRSRVKRAVKRQEDPLSFTGVYLIDSLADVAKAFLYPETNNKENSRNNKDGKVDSSMETAELTFDDSYYDEEEETFTTMSSTTTGRSLETRTPPPNLGAVPPSSSVKRPIPLSSPSSSFDPVFPSSSFGESHHQPSPIARMRAPVPEPTPPQEPSYDEQSRYSENFVADKHRKWRRQIKLQNKRLASKQDDDASLLTTCAPPEKERNVSKKSGKEKRRQEPVRMLAQLMRAPCANVDDAIADCHEFAVSSDEEDDDDIRNNSLLYDEDDEDSTHYDTSVTESEGTDERRSDFTGGTESTVSSARRQSPASAASSARTPSSAPGNPPLRGVLKASSFGNSSVQTSSSAATSHEKSTGDQNFIKTFIEELTQDGTLLIWHGPQGESTAFRRPCGVIAHLKLGAPTTSDGTGSYGGPQLVWQKQDGSDGGVIDLFDIQSMDTASIDMLEQYQFAIPENTFFVVLDNGKHVVFEASSDSDAKRFIHGLKWVVARLSFNLVVGNPLVSCELLSVGGSQSPQTPMEEAVWSKAMNDVTNHLVDKSLTK